MLDVDWGQVRRVTGDLFVVLVALLLSLDLTARDDAVLQPLGGATAVVLSLAALSLYWRRRAPLAVAWIIAVTAVLLPVVESWSPGTLVRAGADAQIVAFWPPAGVFAAYSVLARAEHRRAMLHAWVPVTLIVISAASVARLLPTGHMDNSMQSPGAAAFRGIMFVTAAVLAGLYAGARRKVLRELVERAERAERERHLEAEKARVEERNRLAAEMHDLVTHRVTLMVMQAGALGMTSEETAVKAAAEELRATGCQALEELRDAVGLLRRDPDHADGHRSATDEPAVLDLASLIEASRSVGVPLALVEEGSATLASPVVGRTAYRVVQEALTNARKHAPGAKVEIRVHYRADGVRLTVRNSAATRSVDTRLTAAGSRTGLSGLRQRVELVNGKLEAGPDGAGGFCVDVVLPAYVQTAAGREPIHER
jgi:signal transduction histidine kinase